MGARSPRRSELPDLDLLADAVSVVASATSPRRGRRAAPPRRCARCATARPPGIDAGENPGCLRHADGTLEEILHLGTPPLQTSPWWLTHLLSCPLPATVAVHITVGHRGREQGRQRRRWKRLRAAVIYKQRRGQLVGSDEHEALEEAASRRRRARLRDRRDRLQGRDLLRDPRPPRRAARVPAPRRRHRPRVPRAHQRPRRPRPPAVPARIHRDARRSASTRSTRRRSYAQRNIAHCVPLTSTSCGSPSGLILGFADPGGTLERIDPFDPLYPRRVTLVLGPSGGGKTVLMNVLLMRAISQGMRGWIIDRSSTPDQRRSAPPAPGTTTRCSRWCPAPGACRSARAPATSSARGTSTTPHACRARRHEFLLALHALLIGHAARRRRAASARSTAVEEGLLSTAIDAVYARCATNRRAAPRDRCCLHAARSARAARVSSPGRTPTRCNR